MRTMIQLEKDLPQFEAVALLDEERRLEPGLVRENPKNPDNGGADKTFPLEEARRLARAILRLDGLTGAEIEAAERVLSVDRADIRRLREIAGNHAMFTPEFFNLNGSLLTGRKTERPGYGGKRAMDELSKTYTLTHSPDGWRVYFSTGIAPGFGLEPHNSLFEVIDRVETLYPEYRPHLNLTQLADYQLQVARRGHAQKLQKIISQTSDLKDNLVDLTIKLPQTGAGQQLGAAIPNHIVLDSETGIAVWKTKEEGTSGNRSDSGMGD